MANGLINLQTDLKSLRYGNDKPYITKNIGDAPGSQIGMEVQARIDDTSRIAQMLIDKPGLRFIGNQALLQQVDIQGKLQKARDKKTTLGGKIFEQVKGTVLNTAKIVGSTLAQVPVNGTGTHFVYGFRTDTYLSPATTNSFTQFFGAGGVEGAPLALRGEVIPVSKLGTTPEGTQLAETTARPEQLGQLHIGIKGDITPLEQPVIKPFREEDQKKKAKNSTKDNIDSALAGAQIPVGTIPTNFVPYDAIKLSEAPSGSIGTTFDPGQSPDKYSATTTYTGRTTEYIVNNAQTGSPIPVSPVDAVNDGIHPLETTYSPGEMPGSIDKVVQKGTVKQENVTPIITHLGSIRKETRVLLGDQGRKKASYTNYTTADPLSQDLINMLDVSDRQYDAASEARDLAKLFFEIITPEKSKFLNFRAFIDNIDDSYSADWQGTKYVGRAENFYTYGGFDRDINFSFKVVAATRKELRFIYRKMVYLASVTAPTYAGGSTKYMRGTLARITIGSYFDHIPGVITSVKFNLIEDLPWEIALGHPEGLESDVQELPTGLQCSVTFKPIHDFVPQTGFHHYFTAWDEKITFFDEDRYIPNPEPVPTPPTPDPDPTPRLANPDVREDVPIRVNDNTAVGGVPSSQARAAGGYNPDYSNNPKNRPPGYKPPGPRQANADLQQAIQENAKKKKYNYVNT